ncbi:MAG: TVP38/TMEM64 family protein [Clostridia bacterium]|nr:TVP38/TMEM64 family protein [Clostridia bacterium]
MKKKNIIKHIKIISLIIISIAFIGLIVYFFPLVKNLSTHEGQVEFKDKIQSTGIYGFLTLLGLQVAQILLVIVPGEPLEILAGMCYGAVGGTIFTFFSVGLTTTIIYWMVRKFGKKFIYQSFDKKKIDKIEHSKIFQNPKKIELILAICFAITGVPKDILVYIGGLLPVKPLRFILIATFCRFPSVVSSTIVGKYFSEGNWKVSLIVYGITFALTMLTLAIIRIFDKEKITEKAIEELK